MAGRGGRWLTVGGGEGRRRLTVGVGGDGGRWLTVGGPETGTPEVKVFEYSVGGAFGELALLHGEPRQVPHSPFPPT